MPKKRHGKNAAQLHALAAELATARMRELICSDHALMRIVTLAPFQKERPRVTKWGTHMPKAYIMRRDRLRELFGEVPWAGRMLRLSVLAGVRMPMSASKQWWKDNIGRPCPKTPDMDNIVGGVMDSIFADDSKVTQFGQASKIWMPFPFLQIQIEPADLNGYLMSAYATAQVKEFHDNVAPLKKSAWVARYAISGKGAQ